MTKKKMTGKVADALIKQSIEESYMMILFVDLGLPLTKKQLNI